MRRKKESEKTSSVKSGRWFIKITSLILSVLVVFFMIPVVSYAEMIETAEELLSAKPEEAEEKISLSYTSENPAYELVEMREERAKYFRMEDGTYVVASYEYPVHTMQDGEWVDVDNSLTDNGNEIFTSNARIKFAKKITGNGRLFTLHESNHKLTLSLIGAVKKTEGKIIASESEGEKEEKKTLGKLINLENITSRVIYEDILEGVDIEYVLESTNLKENIIVKEKSEDGYSYSFELSLNNLTARMTPEGDVQIVNERGGVVYTIPAPVVYDSNGEYADPSSAQQSLEYMGNGKCRLTVSVSEDWMNAEERVYPVTVDPTLSVADSSVIDLYVDSASNMGHYHNATYLKVNNTSNAYWKISDNYLPSLTSSAHITDAVIGFSAYGAADVGAYEISTNWSYYLCYEDTLDVIDDCNYFYGKGKISGNIVDYATVSMPAIYDKTERIEWNITEIAKLWFSGYNYGVGFKLIPDSNGSGAYLRSTEYNATPRTDEYKPTLILRYVDTKGIEDYYTYSSQSAGLAGSSSINLATGNLTFAINTLTSSDYLMPVSPTLVYDGSVAGSSYVYGGKSKIAFSNQSGMAYGFKLNLSETVVKEHFLNSKKETEDVYIYSDGDGTEHDFYQALDENDAPIANTYHDDSGLRLTLVDSSDGFTITSLDGTVKSFTKGATCPYGTAGAWYLSRITDRAGNAVEITLNSNYLPTSTKLIPNGSTAIETLRFIYNSSGKLVVIRNVASGESVVFKYSNSTEASSFTDGTRYLRNVIYAHGTASLTDSQWLSYANGNTVSGITTDASAYYEYNSFGRLTTAKDELSQRYLVYSYTYGSGAINNVTEYGSSGGEGQSIKIIYRNGYTEVTTSGADDRIYTTADNIITRYTFDRSARVISSYSTNYNRTEIYGATSGTYEEQDNIKNNIKESIVVGGGGSNYLLNGDFQNTDAMAAYWTVIGGLYPKEHSTEVPENQLAVLHTSANYKFSEISQMIELPAGHDYTVSFEYRSEYTANAEAYVGVRTIDGSTNLLRERINLEKANIGKMLDASYSFNVSSSNVDFLEFYISIANTEGYTSNLILDNVTITRGIGGEKYNLASYGNFEESHYLGHGDYEPISVFWKGNSGYSRYNTTQPFGTVAKLTSEGLASKQYIYQTVYKATNNTLAKYDSSKEGVGTFKTNANQSFTVSGFGYSNSIISNEKGKFGIKVSVYYYQGEGADDVVKEYFYPFVNSENAWQFTSGTFSGEALPIDEDDTADYSCIHKIEVACEYSNQLTGGIAMFDNITVNRTAHNSKSAYNYDDSGNITEYKTSNGTMYYEYLAPGYPSIVASNQSPYFTKYEYDEYGNLRREIILEFKWVDGNDNTVNETDFYYAISSERNDVSRIVTPLYMTSYQYNDYGLCTLKTFGTAYASGADSNGNITYGHYGSLNITVYTYDTTANSKIFGAQTGYSENNEVTIRNYYDNNSGRLLASVNTTANTGECYVYDSLGRIICTRPATVSSDGSGYAPVTNNGSVNYTYDQRGLLETLSNSEVTYNFSYNQFGNIADVTIGESLTAVQYEYNSYNGKIKKITYSGGYSERYVYDHLDNISGIWYTVNGTETKAYEYKYTKNGQLNSVTDYLTDRVYVYGYDLSGRVIGYSEYSTEDYTNEVSAEYRYDDQSRLTANLITVSQTVGSDVLYDSSYYFYEYTADGKIAEFRILGAGVQESFSYDELNRLTSVTNTGGYLNTYIEEEYTYDNETKDRVNSYSVEIKNSDGNVSTSSNTLTYDSEGRLTSVIYANGKTTSYVYDSKGQLVRENNQSRGETYFYMYDGCGNLILKSTHNYSTGTLSTMKSSVQYSYSDSAWGDILTSYGDEDILSDAYGNILGFGEYEFLWQAGKLTGAESSDHTISYTYNDEGLRIGKTVNGVQHRYVMIGTQLISEIFGAEIVTYFYDASGRPIGMRYMNTDDSFALEHYFYFELNIFGDIVAVYDEEYNKILSYSYDAWGNFTTTVHTTDAEKAYKAQCNSLTYRGYYYDRETNLYYLQTRYYSPELCRFISADSVDYLDPDSITGLNLFAYCGNDPVNFVDPSGHMPEWLTDIGRFLGGLAITVVGIGSMVATVELGGTLCLFPGFGTLLQYELSMMMYGGFMMASSWDPLIQADMEAIHWNPFNSNPDMSSVNKVSFYKGEAVIIQYFAPGSFSFGIMGLYHKEKSDIEKVKHEWGHFAQLSLHGPAAFTLFIAIPSISYNIYCKKTGDWTNYYNMPWEWYADYLGGARH